MALRRVAHALAGSAATRQLYLYSFDPTCKRLGGQAWISLLNLLTELLLCIKYGQGEFPKAISSPMLGITVAFVLVYVVMTVVLMLRFRSEDRRNKRA